MTEEKPLTAEDVRQTEKRVPAAILEEPIKLSVDIKPKNRIHAILQKWNWLPGKKIFTIYPIVAGSLIKISKLLLSLEISPEAFTSAGALYENGYKAMDLHTEAMAKVIAIAITNSKDDPPKKLVDFILYNFTSVDLKSTIGIVITQMDVLSFTSSIISVRAMNLLKMSPKDQGR